MNARLATSLRPWSLMILVALFVTAASAEVGSDDIGSRLRNFTLSPIDTVAERKLTSPRSIARFYRGRAARPAWVTPDGKMNEEARALLQAINDSWKDGLMAKDYHLETLDRLVSEGYAPISLAEPDTTKAERAFAIEILLTDAFLALGDHLYAGRIDPASINVDWEIRIQRIDMVKALEEALRGGDVVASLIKLAPPDPRYQQLKAAFIAYKSLAPKDSVSPLSETPLKRGAQGEHVRKLKERMVQEGLLDSASAKTLRFDEPLEKALRAFQVSRGLEPNGRATAATIALLNTPREKILAQIEANLERLRWLPRQLGQRYVFVDIAGFNLKVYEANRRVLSMRIIVGDDYRRTPMLSTRLTGIVLNPYWTIPSRILIEEIIPHAEADPAYLTRRNIRVYEDGGGARKQIDPEDIDWWKVKLGGSPYLFLEDSGPQNPLGNVKFVIRNDFSVYLHGTPNSRLFRREDRALSHGCIRVENPVALAAQLLKGSSPPWRRRDIESAISEGLAASLPLPSPIPVYVWYRTAWADNNGLNLRRDIYGWDELLAGALEGKPPLVPKELQRAIRGKATAKRGKR